MAMKMVWKSGTKREKLRPRRSANLPFEAEEEKDEQEILQPTDENLSDSGAKSLDSRSTEKDDLKQLFESLQSQGNQLAEVSIGFLSLFTLFCNLNKLLKLPNVFSEFTSYIPDIKIMV
jgi:hypothetical protein